MSRSPESPGSASVASFLPVTSSSDRPQRAAAAAFQTITVPSRAVVMTGARMEANASR